MKINKQTFVLLKDLIILLIIKGLYNCMSGWAKIQYLSGFLGKQDQLEKLMQDARTLSRQIEEINKGER